MKDVIEIGQVQRVRHSHEADDYWVDVVENSTENQSFEGVAGILSAYADPRP